MELIHVTLNVSNLSSYVWDVWLNDHASSFVKDIFVNVDNLLQEQEQEQLPN